jgi:cell division protease FtsH
MAGRISEEIFLNTATTGAGSDFDKATAIARQMVCEWGMSPLGPIRLGQKDELIFLGREMMYHNEYSEETARKIDQEVKNIIDRAYQKTTATIMANKDSLEKIAQGLLERESLSSANIDDILNGIDLPPINNETKKEKDETETETETAEAKEPGSDKAASTEHKNK